MYLSRNQCNSLARLARLFAEEQSEREIRKSIGEEVLRLLEADYFASYVWNEEICSFQDRIFVNMSEANLDAYEAYYQYRDPITRPLQAMRVATLVEQVLPYEALVRTEFFNDFLAKDGLHYGINMFAWSGSQNIGDMRVWRRRGKDRFSEDAVLLLEMIRPAFTAALLRARRGSREAAQPSGGLENRENAALNTLSPRERDVADLVFLGMSDKMIASKLGISFPTVRTHLSHIFQKLNVDTRVNLIRKMNGLMRFPL